MVLCLECVRRCISLISATIQTWVFLSFANADTSRTVAGTPIAHNETRKVVKLFQSLTERERVLTGPCGLTASYCDTVIAAMKRSCGGTFNSFNVHGHHFSPPLAVDSADETHLHITAVLFAAAAPKGGAYSSINVTSSTTSLTPLRSNS